MIFIFSRKWLDVICAREIFCHISIKSVPIILKSVLYVCHVVGLYMRKSKFYTLKIWLFQKYLPLYRQM